MYQVKATHKLVAGGDPACEIYPDVFVTERYGAISPYPSQAQFGHPCEPLSADADITFIITDRHIKDAMHWAESIHHPVDGIVAGSQKLRARRSAKRSTEFGV